MIVPKRHILSFTFLLLLMFSSYSQDNKQEFKPYTIETTYKKLKKYYPDVSPIEPIVSDKIKAETNVVYKTINGSQLKVDIYSPNTDETQTYPAVLLIHGGGWLTGSKENQQVMAQHLALKNYVAITVSYRLGLEAPYPAAVLDLKDAILWIRKNAKTYNIEPNNIAVLGTSAGAQLATLIGVAPKNDTFGDTSEISKSVKAIINIDGIVSFIHPEASAEGKMASIWLNGTKSENFKNWKEASPLEYVNASTPPTLFINSSQERFHAGRNDMILLLDKYKIYSETHTLEDSPHSFWLLHPWFETTLNHTVNFLNEIMLSN